MHAAHGVINDPGSLGIVIGGSGNGELPALPPSRPKSGKLDRGMPVFATSAFQTANPPSSELHDLFTIFLSTAGSGGIDHVVNDTGRSSTAANPDTPVDVFRHP